MKRVLLTTLGCKVNQFESAAFRTAFTEAGCTVVKAGTAADIIVINTCAVTSKAGSQSRQAVRQALKKNPQARIIITGCYTEIAANELAEMKELHDRQYVIIGNSVKDQLVPTALVPEDALPQLLLGSISEAKEICRLPVRHFGDRTRAYMRVQDGCESYCTYCIVPYTRGPSRSLPLDEVLSQATVFADEGYKEIVLTGIHLGYYGRDLSTQLSVTELIDQLSAQTPDVRYRISSLEPTEITPELLLLMRTRENIMPHLHIPLQSGDDQILARMNRRYTTAEFCKVVESCRAELPHAAIGIDILAGFPGETEEQFTHSKDFLASLSCTYLHVFPYSRRAGTVAAGFKDDVSTQQKEQRVLELRTLSDNKCNSFYRSQVGRTVQVLVEGKRDSNGLLKGFSDNYVPVHFPGNDILTNSVITVRITEFDGTQVLGEVFSDNES